MRYNQARAAVETICVERQVRRPVVGTVSWLRYVLCRQRFSSRDFAHVQRRQYCTLLAFSRTRRLVSSCQSAESGDVCVSPGCMTSSRQLPPPSAMRQRSSDTALGAGLLLARCGSRSKAAHQHRSLHDVCACCCFFKPTFSGPVPQILMRGLSLLHRRAQCAHSPQSHGSGAHTPEDAKAPQTTLLQRPGSSCEA
jgi:hypothetical protein